MHTNRKKTALMIGEDTYSYSQLYAEMKGLITKLDKSEEGGAVIVDIQHPLKYFAAIFASLQMKKTVVIFDYKWPDNYKKGQLEYFDNITCVVSDVTNYKTMGIKCFYDYKENLNETCKAEDTCLCKEGIIVVPTYYMGERKFLEITTQMIKDRLMFCEEILKISWNCVRSFGICNEELLFELFTLIKGGTLVIENNIEKSSLEYDCVIAKLPKLNILCDYLSSKHLITKKIITYGMDILNISNAKKRCKEMGVVNYNFYDYPYYRFITSVFNENDTVFHKGKTVRGVASCILNDGGKLENSDISGHVGVIENKIVDNNQKMSNVADEKPVVFTGFYGKKSKDAMICFQKMEGDVIYRDGKIISLNELKKCLCECEMIDECEYEYTADSAIMYYSLKEEALGFSYERIKAYIDKMLPDIYKEISLIKCKTCDEKKVKTVSFAILQKLKDYLKKEGWEVLVEPDVNQERAVEVYGRSIETTELEKKVQHFFSVYSADLDTVQIFSIKDEEELNDLEKIRNSTQPILCEYKEEEHLGECEKKVLYIFKKILQKQNIHMSDNFFDCGGNSVSFIKLCSELSKLAGFEVSMQDVIGNATPQHCIEVILVGKSEKEEVMFVDVDTLKKDADINKILSESIDMKENSTDKQPDNIFLTGASGFVGSFLLKYLLEEKDGLIYCLVRTANEKEGMEKLYGILKRYGLESSFDENRIRIVLGDLEKEKLGCTTEMYETLAKDISVIYHNGAKVDFFYPYQLLKQANVEGTKEIIKLAACKHKKEINYISSASVLSGIVGIDDLDEQTNILEMPPRLSGYNQSKWVSDVMMQTARKHDLKCNIFRLGTACGDSVNGCCQVKDFAWLVIRLSIEIGFYTDFNLDLNLIPVDYIAKAIVRLSTEDKTDNGTNYHIFGKESTDIRQIFQWLQDYGYDMEEVPFDIWCLQVENYLKTAEASEELQAVYAVIAGSSMTADDLDEDAYENVGVMNSDWTVQQLRNLNEEFHAVTKEQFFNNINYFSKIGFLKEVKRRK